MRQRELERLNDKAARLVMGWVRIGEFWHRANDHKSFARLAIKRESRHQPCDFYFNPGADISDAWMLIEEMQRRNAVSATDPVRKWVRDSDEWSLFDRGLSANDVFEKSTRQAAESVTLIAVTAVLEAKLREIESSTSK